MIRFATTSALALALAAPVLAIDDAHRAKGQRVAAQAIDFLRKNQDPATGGWAVPPAGRAQPVFPAFTGLVLNGMLMQPGVDAKDPAVKRGVEFILKYVKPDGGIYDGMLASYNTAISVSALTRAGTPEARAPIPAAIEFLRNSQWGATSPVGVGGPGGREAPSVVGKEHPFYGGVGYGSGGRPDLSNLQFMLQALQDAGVPSDDVAVQRAVVFLQRIQMLHKAPDGTVVNDMPFATGTRQGGFVYATAETTQTAGQGESKASTIEETLDDGTKVSRLRCYGSMTYAGFKSYLYAGLTRDDPRVVAAMDWIRRNYTLAENPGIGTEGMYYYFVTFSRALDATGSATIVLGADAAARDGRPAAAKDIRDWQNDLVDRLAELQNDDGSFKVHNPRWMEDNPVLITAYGLIAVQHAIRE